jgi:hypothetical protein
VGLCPTMLMEPALFRDCAGRDKGCNALVDDEVRWLVFGRFAGGGWSRGLPLVRSPACACSGFGHPFVWTATWFASLVFFLWLLLGTRLPLDELDSDNRRICR